MDNQDDDQGDENFEAAPPEDVEENGLADFKNRFLALAREAKSYGIRSLILMESTDPISEDFATATIRTCTPIWALGLVVNAQRRLQRVMDDSEDFLEGIDDE